MKYFEVKQEFWNVFPNSKLYVLIVSNINNQYTTSSSIDIQTLLLESTQKAKQFLQEENFSSNEIIQEWRQAYSQFKTKKGARSSIEALLKRASQGHEFQTINPLVDLYNSISLSYGVPCGGEDIDQIQGELFLGKAFGGEAFLPLGSSEDAPALPGEMIYADQVGAICRCLNWREAQRTMLTDRTKNAVLVIEAINERQQLISEKAIDNLKTLVDTYFQTEAQMFVISSESPRILIQS